MKKGYFKILLCTIIIILIIIMILISVLAGLNKNKVQNQTDNNQLSEPPVLDENIIIPSNSYLFFGKYVNGDIESKEIYETIYEFSNVIITNYYYNLKNLNQEQIEQYYIDNEESISKYIQVNGKQEFNDFVKVLKGLTTEKLTLESMEFKEDEITYTNIATTSKIKLKYKDNKEIILNVKVYKRRQDNGKNIIFY